MSDPDAPTPPPGDSDPGEPRAGDAPVDPLAATVIRDGPTERPATGSDPPSGLERDGGVELRRFSDEAAEPVSAVAAPEATADSAGGQYRFLRVLGKGGMGTVYLVEDRDLRRRVALKILRPGLKRAEPRFIEEAQILGQLDHPGIVALHALGIAPAGQPFCTMRYVRGRSLAQVLQALRDQDPETCRSHSLSRLAQILVQIGHAVAYAHARGVVHRDLKPANVMLGEFGEVQVVDWGLARILSGASVATNSQGALTVLGQIIGTPGYMSPEQALGQEADERADVWALGIILYEMLTLSRPFSAPSSVGLMRAIIAADPVPPRERAPGRDIPPALEELCLAALAKEPEARCPSAAAFIKGVEGWLDREADRTRRREAADAAATAGRAALARYLALKQRCLAEEQHARTIAASFRGWQPAEEKRPVLEAEARVEGTREALEREASRVVTTLGSALGFDADHEGARETLADFYFERLREAEERAATADARFYAELVAEYHAGKYQRELSGAATLTLDSDPPGAEVTLHELVEDGFVLVERPGRVLGHTPLAPLPLERGSYLLVLRRDGFRDLRYPVHIARGEPWSGSPRLYRDREIGEGAVLVPGGPFVLGGDPQCRGWALEAARPTLPDFAIAEHPVTMAQYLEFLHDLALEEPLVAWRRAPRRGPTGGQYVVRREDGRLDLPEIDAEGDRWCSDWPVFGISWHDAVAWCEWRSRREGRLVRLPDEVEWEKAARGVDGRFYPWGNRFDPSLCNMRESRRERPSPVAIREFPSDVSVYGVRGLGGNVRTWTATESADGEGGEQRIGRIVRGGAWFLARVNARSANRIFDDPSNVSDYIGLRWVRPLGAR